jgi:hypothetical protein
VIRPDRWKVDTRQAHGAPCTQCGAKTYTLSGICKGCKTKGLSYADPARLPEDYLMRCAEELLKRHEAREAALVKLGLRRAA